MRSVLLVVLSTMLAGAQTAPREAILSVPGRVNSTPWVAASGDFVAVAWAAAVAGKGDVFAAISRDGGRTFGQPVMVNAVSGDARIGGEIAPRVSVRAGGGSAPEIAVAWNARDGGTSIRVAKSRDGGQTFGAPVTLQQPGAAGDRGWHASAMDARGTVHTIWLDHRGLAADKAAHGTHKGEHDGVAMARKSSLYYAPDAAGAERELFTGVCYCCKSALAVGPGGEMYAAWRHVFDGNFRDLGFTSSRDGGRTFAPLSRVHQDGWQLNGCPDDGPAMAVDRSGTVHLVWPTLLNGTTGTLLYATSTDGTTFSKPIPVPTLGSPKPSHPQISIDAAGRPIIAWDEVRDGVRRAALRRLRSGAGSHIQFMPIEQLGEGPAAYPMTAAAAGGFVAVWTSGPPDRSVIGVRVVQ